MKEKQFLIIVITLLFYSLNPLINDEKLEMEENEEITEILIGNYTKHHSLSKNCKICKK